MNINNSEKNIRERSLPGVHGLVFTEIINRISKYDIVHFLDLGAGEGAMSKRLHSAGYNVEAVEILRERFQVNHVPCYYLDLNENFAESLNQKYQGIIAIEIIEHLENPRHFLRNCRQLLMESGIIFLSTPNVESWNSRLIFLKHGKLQFFNENNYQNDGHITPIFSWQIKQIADELGFEIISRIDINKKDVWRLAYNPCNPLVTSFLKSILLCFSGIIFRQNAKGAINLFILRKIR